MAYTKRPNALYSYHGVSGYPLRSPFRGSMLTNTGSSLITGRGMCSAR